MWFDVLPIGKSVEKRYCRKSMPRDDQAVTINYKLITNVKESVCIFWNSDEKFWNMDLELSGLMCCQ